MTYINRHWRHRSDIQEQVQGAHGAYVATRAAVDLKNHIWARAEQSGHIGHRRGRRDSRRGIQGQAACPGGEAAGNHEGSD